MLGSRVRFVQGEPGDTILRAIRESELGTVLTLEIPRLGFTWRGLPPRLEVVGRRDRQVLYSRPFVAAGEKAAAEEGPDGEFRSHLYRIVPRLAFHRFELVRTCGNRTSDADGAFLKLEGIHVACPRASCRTRVAVITTRSSPEPALSTRDHSVIFEQVGETGCAGPLSWPAGSRVLLYSPDANWLTQVNLP